MNLWTINTGVNIDLGDGADLMFLVSSSPDKPFFRFLEVLPNVELVSLIIIGQDLLRFLGSPTSSIIARPYLVSWKAGKISAVREEFFCVGNLALTAHLQMHQSWLAMAIALLAHNGCLK